MLYDCFYFFNELDLLEIRLNILNEKVDKFVIVESTESFNGKTKNLFYLDNKNKFKEWEHKIVHHIVDDFPNDIEIYERAVNSPNIGNKEHWWIREFYQKESLIKAIKNCNDYDIIFISDVDEIWNPELNFVLEENKVYRPIQTAYPFYLNNRSNQHYDAWTGTRYSYFKNVKTKGPNHFRTERESPSIKIENGGWHFSWLGKVSDKWNDNHPDNSGRFRCVNSAKMWKDESELPAYLKENKNKWKDLFLQ